MDDNTPIKIRDGRIKNWYYVQNIIVDVYGEIIGPYGHAVYNVLVRHSKGDTGRDSFPSHQTIARKAGCGIAKVKEVVKLLEKLELIKVVPRFDKKTNRQMSNEYIILHPPKKPKTVATPEPPPKSDTPGGVSHVATKNPSSEESYDQYSGTKNAPEQQLDEPEYVDLDGDGFPEKPLSPLVKYLKDNGREIKSDNQKRKLTQAVVVLGESHPSPNYLFENDPLFRDYVDARLAWCDGSNSERKRMPNGTVVSCIKKYDTEYYGWFDFRDRMKKPPEQDTDGSGITWINV